MIIKGQQQEEAGFFQRMEEERIKTIKLMEEREEMKKAERLRGAQVIRRQIEEREQEKIREADRLDQERQAMLKKAEELKNMELAREEERRCLLNTSDAADEPTRLIPAAMVVDH